VANPGFTQDVLAFVAETAGLDVASCHAQTVCGSEMTVNVYFDNDDIREAVFNALSKVLDSLTGRSFSYTFTPSRRRLALRVLQEALEFEFELDGYQPPVDSAPADPTQEQVNAIPEESDVCDNLVSCWWVWLTVAAVVVVVVVVISVVVVQKQNRDKESSSDTEGDSSTDGTEGPEGAAADSVADDNKAATTSESETDDETATRRLADIMGEAAPETQNFINSLASVVDNTNTAAPADVEVDVEAHTEGF